MTEAADPPQRPTLAHRVEYAFYRTFEAVLGAVPLDVVSKIGEWLGLAVWRVSGKHRRLVTRNLRIATAREAPDPTTLEKLVRDTFRRAGGNMMASLRSAIMEPEELRPFVQFEGMEIIQQASRDGRGTVLVWAHMGNWEMLAQLLPEAGEDIRGGPIYRPLANPLLDQLTVDRRTRQGAILFDKRSGFNGPAGLLRSGGVLTIMGDQRAGGSGELCPFFGRLSSCTPLPTLLAKRTKASVVTLSISTTSSGTWKLKVRAVEQFTTTTEIMAALERSMCDSLTDVFWFHDRWRVDRVRPLSFYTKGSPTEAARNATVPIRILATLPKNAPESVTILSRILELRPDSQIEVLDTGHLPPLPQDERISRTAWDSGTPFEHCDGIIRESDERHPSPLDFVLLLDGHVGLAKAAKRFGLRAIIGCNTQGKPWTRSFPQPTDEAGWKQMADALEGTPPSRKS